MNQAFPALHLYQAKVASFETHPFFAFLGSASSLIDPFEGLHLIMRPDVSVAAQLGMETEMGDIHSGLQRGLQNALLPLNLYFLVIDCNSHYFFSDFS